jgi:hypothetical protein
MKTLLAKHLSSQEIMSLLEAGKGTRVSIFLPVQQEVDKRDENRIRLKNCLQAVEEKLLALDYEQSDIEEIVLPAREEFVVGGRFLDTSSPGLVIYLAEGFSQAYQLPFSPEMSVIVNREFQIKQLMPLCTAEPFFVLILGQDSVRLLRATQFAVEQLDLGETPLSLGEALRWDDPERQLQWHSKTGNEADGRAAVYHGHGISTNERHKDDLLRYFQMLNKGVAQSLTGKTDPLILAGVDYLLPIYRETNSYNFLIDNELTGNYEHLSDEEIHRRIWELVQPYFHEKKERLYLRYRELASKKLASSEMTTVLSAAYQGRVDTLVVATNVHLWGEFEEKTGRVVMHGQPEPEDVDLLNLATIYTIVNGGRVYGVSIEEMQEELPEEEPLFALLRF